MAIEIGTQVEVETDTGGFTVAEVTATDGDEFIGSEVYGSYDVRFTEDEVSRVFDY